MTTPLNKIRLFSWPTFQRLSWLHKFFFAEFGPNYSDSGAPSAAPRRGGLPQSQTITFDTLIFTRIILIPIEGFRQTDMTHDYPQLKQEGAGGVNTQGTMETIKRQKI